MNRLSEEYVSDALRSGIDGEAVYSTIKDLIDKSDELGRNTIQIKKTIQYIINMKSSVNNNLNPNYLSNLVRENSAKIISALNNGISPNEITYTMVRTINGNVDDAVFLGRLITAMKAKELRLKNQYTNENARQFVLTNNNNS